MKRSLVCFALAIGALTAPAISFAQSDASLTRAEVRADLVRVEQAGYNPSLGNDLNYPTDIQAAEAKIATQTAQQKEQAAYGGVPQNGSSAAGARKPVSMSRECVDPASFCTIFFGS